MKNLHETRRTFLTRAVAGAAGMSFSLTRRAEANQSDSQPKNAPANPVVIDTHTHFYDPGRSEGVPWPPKNDALLYRQVLPKDYKALPTPQPVTGTVVVEASPWVEDNQWILDLAEHEPFIVGLVGNLPVGAKSFGPHLKRFAANPLFRGLRIGGGKLKECLDQLNLLADLKRLAEHDLALDLLGGPDMLPDVPKLAHAAPELRLIIDHVANVRIDGRAAKADWARGIEAAARHKNVFCKVSGLVEGTGSRAGAAPREAEFYAPVLDTIWKAFGEDRLIYGSNWPVSERFASLATVQGIVAEYFAGKGASALEKVFSRNAAAAYQWVAR